MDLDARERGQASEDVVPQVRQHRHDGARDVDVRRIVPAHPGCQPTFEQRTSRGVVVAHDGHRFGGPGGPAIT